MAAVPEAAVQVTSQDQGHLNRDAKTFLFEMILVMICLGAWISESVRLLSDAAKWVD